MQVAIRTPAMATAAVT